MIYPSGKVEAEAHIHLVQADGESVDKQALTVPVSTIYFPLLTGCFVYCALINVLNQVISVGS